MLALGIIGLPNVGKSTFLNALLSKEVAKVAKHPFTTIEKNAGVVKVPDWRLDRLSKVTGIKEKIPASVKFIDIAGLVKGAHKGEGLGNEFLGHIREVDAIIHVLREFEDETIPHIMGTTDTVRDLEIVETELVLKDLETIEKIKNQKSRQRQGSPKAANIKNACLAGRQANQKLKIINRIWKSLNEGLLIKDIQLSNNEKKEIEELFLLTAKPTLYVLNVSEKELTTHGGKTQVSDLNLRNRLKEKIDKYLVICAQLEAELGSLTKEEAKAYLVEVGVKQSSLDKIITEGFKLLNLLTFFTIAKGKKVQAWSLPVDSTIIEAAAKVHSDFAKGFIKAEVVPCQKLIKIGSWAQAKEEGKVISKGRDYQVQDGDVVEFKFSL